ncbi:FKBP-type peptidyl-prolyl cis-trans isomerase [Melia azedarach]|uniref:FKBP-type peptidyl-prolyl cis-trans isomerase n=1 Tax=Melia azedarach TaxID=155640 RepID=A0ACC1Y7P5_MELAZ|nr:FKBP-type peptidyl-prolyl cis-trans isomerase [Melia azedarach]
MATLHLPSNPFPSPRATYLYKPHAPKPSTFTFTTRATDPETPAEPETSQPDSDEFESRLSQVRIRYRSGTGKKAEVRKSKKGSTTAKSASSMYLPPVPLREPRSGGVKVDFGFSPYSERINGRIAILGLAALLAVELATGKGVINYHTPAIVLIQVYFVAAVSALFVKYEKERVSVWPESAVEKK